MLLPDLTTGTQRAILASLGWQAALNSADMEPVHLLLGLLYEDEGTIASHFQQQQKSITDVLQATGIEPQAIAPPEELPIVLPSLVTRLLYDARLIALDQMGTPQVHSQHLLQALVKTASSLRNTLTQLGIRVDLYDEGEFAASLPLSLDEPLEIHDSLESRSLARILDANANRAREALRVLEELARFHLNDAYTSKLAKELRHDLTRLLLEQLPQSMLLASRDTEHDVGTQISSTSERHRHSLTAVLQANAQRLQEALRSLEEYGKIVSSILGAGLEQLRYRSYTLQRCLFANQQARDKLAAAQLYLLVSKSSCAASLEWTILEAAAGGVSIVQLREKNKTDRELLVIGKEVRRATRQAGILFILNDRPDLARLLQADGVHLGQDDVDVSSARQILGSEAIIGVSTHHLPQLDRAILDGADYVGVGPTFASQTKSFESFAGLDYIRQVARHTSLPAYAIGGITADNVNEVVAAGLHRVAIGQGITQADDPRGAARVISAVLIKKAT